MCTTIKMYFLIFISYAFLGWCVEVVRKLIQCKRFINRGFLIGPCCPIYGIGALLITVILSKFTNYPLFIFVLSLLICSILEYSTSLILEKTFHARWWDYSDSKYNLNGRICLDTMIPFGILSILVVYFINPLLFKIIEMSDKYYLNVIVIMIKLIFLIDLVLSIIILLKIRNEEKLAFKDNTEELRGRVNTKIKNQGILFKRVFKAFPNYKYIGKVIKEKTKKAKTKIDNYMKDKNKRRENKI